LCLLEKVKSFTFDEQLINLDRARSRDPLEKMGYRPKDQSTSLPMRELLPTSDPVNQDYEDEDEEMSLPLELFHEYFQTNLNLNHDGLSENDLVPGSDSEGDSKGNTKSNIYIYIYTHTYIYALIHLHTHIYICINTFTHTYIYIH